MAENGKEGVIKGDRDGDRDPQQESKGARERRTISWTSVLHDFEVRRLSLVESELLQEKSPLISVGFWWAWNFVLENDRKPEIEYLQDYNLSYIVKERSSKQSRHKEI